MSVMAELLDAMADDLVKSFTKEQIAKLAVGYFAAVETWEVSDYDVTTLKEFHRVAKAKLTGRYSEQG